MASPRFGADATAGDADPLIGEDRTDEESSDGQAVHVSTLATMARESLVGAHGPASVTFGRCDRGINISVDDSTNRNCKRGGSLSASTAAAAALSRSTQRPARLEPHTFEHALRSARSVAKAVGARVTAATRRRRKQRGPRASAGVRAREDASWNSDGEEGDDEIEGLLPTSKGARCSSGSASHHSEKAALFGHRRRDEQRGRDPSTDATLANAAALSPSQTDVSETHAAFPVAASENSYPSATTERRRLPGAAAGGGGAGAEVDEEIEEDYVADARLRALPQQLWPVVRCLRQLRRRPATTIMTALAVAMLLFMMLMLLRFLNWMGARDTFSPKLNGETDKSNSPLSDDIGAVGATIVPTRAPIARNFVVATLAPQTATTAVPLTAASTPVTGERVVEAFSSTAALVPAMDSPPSVVPMSAAPSSVRVPMPTTAPQFVGSVLAAEAAPALEIANAAPSVSVAPFAETADGSATPPTSATDKVGARDGYFTFAAPSAPLNGSSRDTLTASLLPVSSQAIMLVMVFVGRGEKFALRRHAIRESWGNPKLLTPLRDGTVALRFFVGKKACPLPVAYRRHYFCDSNGLDVPMLAQKVYNRQIDEEQRELDKETMRFGDIVQVPMVDVYRGVARKLKESCRWALDNTKARWFMVAFDDSFVRIDMVLARLLRIETEQAALGDFLSSRQSAQVALEKPILVGRIFNHEKVHRTGKWAEKVYKPPTYPSFPLGSMLYAFSRPLGAFVVRHDGVEYQAEDTSLGIWLDEANVETIFVNERSFNNQRCFHGTIYNTFHEMSGHDMQRCAKHFYGR
eukprot:TRINITY_DN54539_c0_g1_i1.p1 TRINITY_DN54539_c0_g1~~TRINITY_DN54539_c0_g1_i1.p1  ORF type:complete len:807 (+),score=131.34 TRINITY_DN54539_c0_g1_i1:241-2661(+)